MEGIQKGIAQHWGKAFVALRVGVGVHSAILAG